MFSHMTLGTNGRARAKPFWMAVANALNLPVFFEMPDGISFGTATGPKLFIGQPFDGKAASHGNGTHVAFVAQDRASVDAFNAAAMAHGGSDEGSPGLRPHYHPNYYGAYVRDPDCNKLQAVCHSAAD